MKVESAGAQPQLTNKKVVALQICGERVDNQDDHVALVVQEQRRCKISHLGNRSGLSWRSLRAVCNP